MRVMSVSHMFPNHVLPNYGVFVKERLKAVAGIVDVKVVAPLPCFPFFKKYQQFHNVPCNECYDSLVVFHPRYAVIPKFFKCLDGYLYYWSINTFFSQQNKNFDLLDFHWIYPDALAGLKWARRYNKKIVVTIRGNESIYYFENKPLIKKFIINTLKNVDHIISVSNDLKNKVVKEYGIDQNKVTVIPNGIETEKFKIIDRKKAREFCGLEQNKKYILSLSRLSHEKGLEHLFEAFSSLDINNIKLIVVGDGPLKEKLCRIALDLGITKNVEFIGTVAHDETAFWYNAADVYCLPSLWEGCPNVIIESLACGTPVVSTNVGGIPDLVLGDDYGYLVSAGESGSLAKALDKALEKKWDRQQIAQYGMQNTWGHVARRVVSVFQSLLKD